ncbi:calcineurin-like phosphoesterase C-terminal domain-containing protein [Zhouia sp. PK063]|uniref:calcineurin-like phosphoesterase C-terminal domain-containing protein n=1 Tax=Zhouia sp. PK063 TaxID=3373602 RepID=UPI0037BA4888
MLRRHFFRNMSLLSAGIVLPAKSMLAEDKKENSLYTGQVLGNNAGIEKVAVSNGFDIVYTDNKGYYELPQHEKAKFIFISLPAGYEIPTKKGIAQFYQEIATLKSTENINFSLKKLKVSDDKHKFIVWADPQIRTKKDAHLLNTISAPDTLKHIQTLGKQPIFGIGCGDLIWDKYELFTDYRKAVAQTKIPFWQVIGNHDQDYSARSDEGSANKFSEQFGPNYYSFNRGKVHYVVLDDVFFMGIDRRYIGYVTETQLEWLEKDLKTIPEKSLVVVALHIPTHTGNTRRQHLKEDKDGSMVMNRQALYDILKNYKVQFISGHTHFNEVWEKDNMMEHNLGTLCGAWWTGPICGDGTPSGYSVFEVDGNEVSWYYKSTGYEKEHQLKIHTKGTDKELPQHIIANVWNYDPAWKVEWFEDGTEKGEMQQYTGLDPEAVQLYLGEQLPQTRKWVEPMLTDHLFIAKPSNTAKQITVKVTDRFGNVYQDKISL